MPRANRIALVLLITITAVAACAPGKGVADRIRDAGSALVVKVEYHDGNPLVARPELVRVYLLHGTTEVEATEFWCSVVVPAGGADLPEHTVVLVNNDPQAGDEPFLALDPVCPE